MFEITTERLRLVPLELDYLLMLKDSRSEFENALGLNESNLSFSGVYQDIRMEQLEFWLENAQSLDEDYRWHTNWEIVNTELNESIGTASFFGAPNRKGEVILGYFIGEQHRRQGYMTEALKSLSDWAIKFGKAKRVISFVESESAALDGLLQKCGFRKEVIYVKEN